MSDALNMIKRWMDTPGTADEFSEDDCYPVLKACETELTRLAAIVAKLPFTADGVPVYPGMEIWGFNAHAVIRKICDGGEYGYTAEWEDAEGPQGWIALKDAYSTRAAAEAAAQPQPK